MRQISTENVADFRSDSRPNSGSGNDDVNSATGNCATASGCAYGCRSTPLPSVHISTITPPSYVPDVDDDDDNSSMSLSLCSSSGVTETGSQRTNCSTPPLDGMTSSAGTVRETAIIGGDSSDERLDRTESCYGRVSTSCDVALGTSLIRRPLSGINSRRESQESSDLLRNCDFVSRLDHGPETDIVFSDTASEVGRKNSLLVPEVETYLRLPLTSPHSQDVNRSSEDNSPAYSLNAGENEASASEGSQVDAVEYPEVNSTTTTTTMTMSLGRRSSSVGAINRVGVELDVIPLPSVHRHSSPVRDRRCRLLEPETEARGRRLTSPLDRSAVTAALNAGAEQGARFRAVANWTKLRDQLRQRRFAVDEHHLRAAALRVIEDQALRRSRSIERRVPKRRRHRTLSNRDRLRRCNSVEPNARRRFGRVNRSNTVDNDPVAVADDLPFRPISGVRPPASDPEVTADRATTIPIQQDADSVDATTIDLVVGGGALPYDYEPLDFADAAAAGGPFGYADDPFDYADDPFEYDDVGGHEGGGKVTVPITICLVIIAGYIFAGAVLFTLWEDWDYLTGSYFCFITLSTIGFGDIVPGTDMDKWASSEKLVLCALWLAFGLSLLAMCFNLMQEEVKEKCKWIGLKLGLLRDDEPQ